MALTSCPGFLAGLGYTMPGHFVLLPTPGNISHVPSEALRLHSKLFISISSILCASGSQPSRPLTRFLWRSTEANSVLPVRALILPAEPREEKWA